MPADRKPIIWAFSKSRLQQVFEAVAPLHAERAVIRVFPASYEEALATSRELAREGERADVFVAAGANGAYLRMSRLSAEEKANGVVAASAAPTGTPVCLSEKVKATV